MAERVELTTHLPCSPDEAWKHVGTSALLHLITSPLIKFVPQQKTPFPARWEEGEYRAWMLFLGVLSVGWQAIRISFPEPENGVRLLRDNGYGPMIKRWDHWIYIESDSEGTRYTDRVDIDAGLLTPFIAAFARIFYAHRQRRWRALAESDFVALGG